MSDIEAIKVLKELSSVSLSWYDKANTKEQKKVLENDIGALDLAIQTLQEKAEREWKKCSDRLPKFDEPLLVYLKNNIGQETMTVAKYQEFTIQGKHIIGWFTTVEPYGENALHNDCVVAWQPLPEPYKEATDDR